MTLEIGYGSYVRAGEGGAERLAEEIDLVEASGFDAMFFSEHHGVEGYPPDPLLVASMALARTSRLRAGPMPMLLPLHDPVRVAESAALADFLSGGRLIMGVGAGYLEREFAEAGVPLSERGRRLDEGIDVLRRVWSGNGDGFDGEVLRVRPLAPLAHPPAQAGGPEIWVAGASRFGVRRAATRGEALVIDSLRPSSEVAALASDYRAACAQAERPGGKVVAMRRAWFGDAGETQAFLDGFQEELRRYVDVIGDDAAPWVDDLRRQGLSMAAVRDRVFAGDPAGVADTLWQWCQENDVDCVILKFQWMGTAGDMGEQLRRAAACTARLRALAGVPA